MTRTINPRSAQEWGAVLPQWVGLIALIFQLFLWAITALVLGIEHAVYEPVMLTAFGGLLMIGQGAQAIVAMKTPPPEPPKEGE